MTRRLQPRVVALSLEPVDASTTLFLGHLAERMAGALQIVRYGDPQMAEAIASASALILVRGLFEFDAAVWSARALGIPLYYFVDDNFILLREQPGPWSPYVGRYSAANVRRRLQDFHGVLLSSDTLIDYFRSESLHRELILFPPIEWRQPLPPAQVSPGAVVVAFFGGNHLHDTFHQNILPAVRRLAAERPVTLIAAGVKVPIEASQGLTIINQPYDPSYERGLRRLAAAGVTALVHPASGLMNDRYKNPHALISARALGAVPIVSDRPPYTGLREAGVALLCGDSPESWYAALSQAALPDTRAALADRLSQFCSTQYSGETNLAAIAAILVRHANQGTGPMAVRQGVVSFFLLFNRIRHGLARMRQRTTTMAMSAA